MDSYLQRGGAPTLFYQIEGAGPPVMLIHGVGADGSSWDAIAPALISRFAVLRLDLRGHGRSGRIPGELTLGDFTRDVVDVLDATDTPCAHIVGFSLGGMIAQALALDHASRVDRLVLLSAVAGRTEPERARVRDRLEILRTQGIMAITGAAQDRWFTDEFVARHPELVRQRMEQLQRNHPPSYAAAYTVFSTTDLADRLHAIDRPTLVATGEHDAGSNTRMARFMQAQIRGAKLQILPGLKHSVLAEAPETIATMLLDFLG
jgi:(E)-2-((N-methylformamido)methylene)succinate hydrolase